jgi:hypothetical protein
MPKNNQHTDITNYPALTNKEQPDNKQRTIPVVPPQDRLRLNEGVEKPKKELETSLRNP